MKYYSLEELLADGDRLPPPSDLDYVEFSFQGTTIRAYGILHGVTGGHNREYYNFVIDSINRAQGLKIGEKGMRLIYKRSKFDYEVDDWLVLRASDSFFLGLQTTLDPRCLWMITIDSLREFLTKADPYPDMANPLSTINESRYFHYLDPKLRRISPHGHVEPGKAMKDDLSILASSWRRNLFPQNKQTFHHAVYNRMMLLKRYMHIPARSIHMLFYVCKLAQKSGAKVACIFIGETHNTDMEYLAQNMDALIAGLDNKEKTVFFKIKSRAEMLGGYRNFSTSILFILLKLRYMVTLLLGAIIPIILYILIGLMVF